jgi:hypothetical protein
VLVGAAAWVARAVAAVRDRSADGARARRGAATVALWLAAPLVVMLSPVRQDGVRYILPALVALSVAAAAGVDWLATAACMRLRGLCPARWCAAAGAALLLYLGVVDLRIHPYYLDYYGEHVGGPAGVARRRRFELGWWGEGIDRAVDHINAHAAPGARVDRRRAVPSHVTWLRGDLWKPEITSGPWPSPQADWVIVNELTWRPFTPPPDLVLAHEVSAMGAPLVRVYRRSAR